MVGEGTLNECKSSLTAHFAISPLVYDHRATWDSREELDDGSPRVGAAGSCSAKTGPPNSSRFVVSVSFIIFPSRLDP